MKTKRLCVLLSIAGLVAVFFSCDIALGSMLDVNGPIVEFTSPVARSVVSAEFEIGGRVSDYSGVERVLIRATFNNIEFYKQWRYTKGGIWEISENTGATWDPYNDPGLQWNGTEKSASFVVPIDLYTSIGAKPENGEYQFSIQAWDVNGYSDDNSFKTRVLIYDNDPPKVSIINLSSMYDATTDNMYDRYSTTYDPTTDTFSNAELQTLHEILDTDTAARTDPSSIGDFLTQEFKLSWQIEDNQDVWSIDLLLFKHNEVIDEDPTTPVSLAKAIYRYHENLGAPPSEPQPENYIKPNGSVQVPDLYGEKGVYDKGGELLNPIEEKTTIKIVALCYDAAGNVNDEKVLGYFVYWPLADNSWITYTSGLSTSYSSASDVYMVYPGRVISATAYQAKGVERVEYTIYKYNYDDTTNKASPIDYEEDEPISSGTVLNEARLNTYSNTFAFSFDPPIYSGYYWVDAKVYDARGFNKGGSYSVFFKVQDITFPDFPDEPSPSASDPLFMHITQGVNPSITISGIVTDATRIDTLCLVWINTASRNYAAMSQLAYYTDKDYSGWVKILGQAAGTTALENTNEAYDPANPNRLWRLNLQVQNSGNPNPLTNRVEYKFEQVVTLAEMGITIGDIATPIESQVFLLRAENPDKKCKIITYAPQGDTEPPVVVIDSVLIGNTNGTVDQDYALCEPGEYQEVLQKYLTSGSRIIVNGRWEEDSTEYLAVQTYLYNNLSVTLNGIELNGNGITRSFTPATGNATNGTFTITANIGAGNSTNVLRDDNIRDAIVIAATITDVGGNPSEAGGSWLIESDELRFQRVSSEYSNKTYKTGDVIDIFLEFNKTVLYVGGSVPTLTLNTGGTATYLSDDPRNLSAGTRKYFRYTVGSGHDTAADQNSANGRLNVNNTGTTDWVWEHTKSGGIETERITIRGTSLPAYTANTSLYAGKYITIDTIAPTVSGFSATPSGWHAAGTDIYITATFSENVTLGATAPRLTLISTETPNTFTGYTTTNASYPRVSGNTIIFLYTVAAGNNTGTGGLRISTYDGNITDLAGNALIPTAISSLTAASRTLSAVHLDTTAPGAPGVSLRGNNNNTVPVDKTMYDDSLTVEITPSSTGDANLASFEYTIDGQDWYSTARTSTSGAAFTISLSQAGSYEVIARQVDRAGNSSADSTAAAFTWDKGQLVSRINSSVSNGTYTNYAASGSVAARQDVIPITVYFRKALNVTSASMQVGYGTTNVATVQGNVVAGQVTSVTFNYAVGASDNTNGNNLTVRSLDINATDTTGVNVSSYVNILPDGNNLADYKQIKIQTGALTNQTPAFGTTVKNSDDSSNTSIVVTFNRDIIKGSGNVTIIQAAANYRLPAVLTDSQYSRYRNVPNFGSFYTRGTNGYTSTSTTAGSSDTSTKYVLNYANDTIVTPNASAAADSLARLAEYFRQAESVELTVNNSSVTVSGNTLTISLTGNNALQVPGASYTVSYPAGFVQDSLGTPSAAVTNQSLTLSGVAKPFIRVNKPTESIGTATASNTQPRLVATQPLTTTVRMDARTPSSTIRYRANEASTSVSDMTWGTSFNADGNTAWGSNPSQPNTISSSTDATAYSAAITLGGTTTTISNVQGYQWHVRARAFSGTAGSDESEEKAYRTVLTYRTDNLTDEAPGQNLTTSGTGNQVWIRGGDAIGASTVPGFPLTWSDGEDESEWRTNLQTAGKRAGIRLLTKVDTNDNLNSATWRWVTWDINVDAYFDAILGRDTGSAVDYVMQYGPQYTAPQRAGWTSFKEETKLVPGKHRWVVTNNPYSGYNSTTYNLPYGVSFTATGKGAVNFSGTFAARPTGLGVTWGN